MDNPFGDYGGRCSTSTETLRPKIAQKPYTYYTMWSQFRIGVVRDLGYLYLHLNLHIYVCIYIYMCIHTYIYIYISISISIYGLNFMLRERSSRRPAWDSDPSCRGHEPPGSTFETFQHPQTTGLLLRNSN